MTLHLRDRRGAASLRYRNRAKITVVMCEQKSNPARFSRMRRSYYPAKCEHAVSVKIFCTHSVCPQDFFVLSLSFIVTLPLADLSAISPIKIAPNLNQQGSEWPRCLYPPDNYSSTQFFQTFKEKYSIMAKSFSS